MRIYSVLIGLAVVLASVPEALAQPVGIVLSVKGQAEVQRAGQMRPLLLGDTLMAGDQIQLRQGSATFLFCPTSERVSLEGDATLRLESDSLQVVDGASPSRKPARRCTLPKVALGEESTERIGGLVARGLAPIPLYLGGDLASARPRFSWEAVQGNPKYEVAVRDTWGDVVWEVETEATELDYPADQPDLKPAKYHWEVVARVSGETVAQQSARFRVKPNPDLAGIEPQSDEEKLLAAVELENNGYFAEAARWIRELRKQNPDDPRFTQRLMVLYWNAGLIPAANQERKRLEKLQAGSD